MLAKHLPGWAQKAFDHFSPMAGLGYEDADPVDVERWEEVKTRFITRWRDLNTARWRAHSKILALFIDSERAQQCILETAFECALDVQANRVQKVDEAARELDSLNQLIADQARHLASLCRQRNTLKEDFGLIDHDGHSLDATNFKDAFELCFRDHRAFYSWCHIAQPETAAWLRIARSQSRPAPGWPELLDVLEERPTVPAQPRDAGAAAIRTKTNSTVWSEAARILIGRLDGWEEFSNEFLASCLNPGQLATLAEVAFDAPVGAYSARQMRVLLQRYRGSKSQAKKGTIRRAKDG